MKAYNMKILIALLPMLISASISSVAAGENGLLQNPSFENDSNFWQKKGNATSIGCYTWHKHQGNSSFGIGNDDGPENAYGEIFQELQVPGSIEKGDFFIFNIWVKTEDRYTGKANLEINFLDSDNKLLKTYKSKVLSGRFDWTKVTVKGDIADLLVHLRQRRSQRGHLALIIGAG